MTRILSGLLATFALVATLLTVSTTVAPTASGADSASSWGTAVAKRQELRSGCRGYKFTYRIDAPGDDWMAEISLVNPAGETLAAHSYKGSAGDPRSATRRFRFCDASTTPGRHKITLKVTSYDARTESSRRSDPTRFRLTRR